MTRRSVPVLLAAIAILLFWTSQAAWGRVVADGMRFKFDLTGVAKITGERQRWVQLLCLAGALAMVAAIELLTRNVGRAVAVYVGRSLEVHGSGLTSAWLVVFLFSAAAALAVRRESFAGSS